MRWRNLGAFYEEKNAKRKKLKPSTYVFLWVTKEMDETFW